MKVSVYSEHKYYVTYERSRNSQKQGVAKLKSTYCEKDYEHKSSIGVIEV